MLESLLNEIYEIFKNTYVEENLYTAASVLMGEISDNKKTAKLGEPIPSVKL